MTSTTNITSGRLAALEAVIERGMKAFIEVGNALLEIRDSRLYRESFATFEDYCQKRWKWGRHYVNRQIAAAGVVRNLEPMGTTPVTERQARELAPLPLEQQREVAATIDFTKATAKEVRVAVEKVSRHATVKATRSPQPRHELDYLDDETRLIREIADVMRLNEPKERAKFRAKVVAVLFASVGHGNRTPAKSILELRLEIRAQRESRKALYGHGDGAAMDLVWFLDWIESELEKMPLAD